ncbi:MAG: decarboxylating 6-phosphogluconate dehydrogenase [Deltaproteobacteria bacterium]|nr:decarboxylating 6-phosphogluconate dehydrogenase [Deltaproteobacteria bacterium]
MKLGFIGLGRMGMNIARRLLRGGHEVVAYNRTKSSIDLIVREGAEGAFSLKEFKEKIQGPRIIWIMLPPGAVTLEHIEYLMDILSPNDIIIDGGNSYYKDDIARSKILGERGIRFMDVGVSGGIWGFEKGYCLMIGGEKDLYEYIKPIFKSLAPEGGYLHCGEEGAGHFVKMIHNGIEYALMQAYGEGFEILASSPFADSIDNADLAHLWNQGSVIRSWLLELAEGVFKRDKNLTGIRGYIEDSGEGRWTVQQAIESGVSAPLITLSLMRRFQSQKQDSFSDRIVAALRHEFGGHKVIATGGS